MTSSTSSYIFRPWIVSSFEEFPKQKFSLLSKKLKYCGNCLTLLQIPSSEKRGIVSLETIEEIRCEYTVNHNWESHSDIVGKNLKPVLVACKMQHFIWFNVYFLVKNWLVLTHPFGNSITKLTLLQVSELCKVNLKKYISSAIWLQICQITSYQRRWKMLKTPWKYYW